MTRYGESTIIVTNHWHLASTSLGILPTLKSFFSTTAIAMSTLDTVSANLFYFSPPSDGSKARSYKYPPPPGIPEINFASVKHVVDIQNIRGQEGAFTLDNSGFQFIQHTSNHTSFTDDTKIEKEYYPESIEVIKQLTGASKVVLFDHSVS